MENNATSRPQVVNLAALHARQNTEINLATLNARLNKMRNDIDGMSQSSRTNVTQSQHEMQDLHVKLANLRRAVENMEPSEHARQVQAQYQSQIDSLFRSIIKMKEQQDNVNTAMNNRLVALEVSNANSHQNQTNAYLDINDPIVRRSTINSLQATVDTLESNRKNDQRHIKELQDEVDDLRAKLARAEVEDATGKIVYPSPGYTVTPMHQQLTPLMRAPMASRPKFASSPPKHHNPNTAGQPVDQWGLFGNNPFVMRQTTNQTMLSENTGKVTLSSPLKYRTPEKQTPHPSFIQTPSRSKLNAIESTNPSPFQQSVPRQELSTLLPMFFFRTERWCKDWTTVPLSGLAKSNPQSSALFKAAGQVSGRDQIVRGFIESPSRYFLIAAILNRTINSEVFNTNIIRMMKTELAMEYNDKALNNATYWHKEPLDFTGRGQNCVELTALATKLVASPGFWAWEETQVERVAQLIVDDFAFLIPAARLTDAVQTLRPIIDNAFRIKVRMMKEVHEYHFTFQDTSDRYDVSSMVVRDDPAIPYTMDTTPHNYSIRISITPSILEKTFYSLMSVELINKAHVFLAPKKHMKARS